MKKIFATLMGLLAGWALLYIPPSRAIAQDFYAGKTIRILVPYPPGGGYDINSRLLARHLGKHIPGHPKVIVQNMPGGGGLIAPNYVYNVAKPDGLTFTILGRNLYADQLIGTEGVQFDLRKVQWIGNSTSDVTVGYMLSKSPYQSIAAIRSAERPPNIGYSGTGSSYWQFTRLLNRVLGLNIKLIGGYQGTSPIKLAMQQGELDGIVGIAYFSAVSALSDELKAGFLQPIIQSGVWDQASSSFIRHPDLKDVPTVWELAPGDQQRRIITLINTADVISRPYIAAPKIPADRVKLLRDGFWTAVTSEAFKRDAKQVFGMLPDPSRGEVAEEFMEKVMASQPEDIAVLKEVLSP